MRALRPSTGRRQGEMTGTTTGGTMGGMTGGLTSGMTGETKDAMRSRLLTLPAAVIVAPVAVLSGYLAAITAAALVPRRQHPVDGELCRFAVLIPAHNEEAGIRRALDACNDLDYPTDRFDVHVVADNCTDGTATVVRACGFTVHERADLDDPGKGPALNWLISRVEAGTGTTSELPDAYVIVDADTVLDPQFLTAMAGAIERGVQAAQGHYAVLESHDSTAAGLRAAALASRHHTRPLGRNRLGGSSGLYGNGMVFTRSVMEGRRWTGHLVEDAEFQMELLLDEIIVEYVPEARLEAEMPDTLDAATTQNQRWELGRIQMAKRYVPALVGRVLRGRPRPAANIDAILDHLVPPLSVLVAADVAAVGVAGATRLLGRITSNGSMRTQRWLFGSAVASLLVLVAHVFVSLRAVRAPLSVYQALLGAPRAVAWKIGLWFDVLRSPTEVSWVRTRRNTTAGGDIGNGNGTGDMNEILDTETVGQ